MSQSQIVRRKCDACAKSHDVDPQNFTAAMEFEVAQWYTIAKEYVSEGGQLVPVIKHACSAKCLAQLVSLGALNLPHPKEQSLSDLPIDMAALQKKAN